MPLLKILFFLCLGHFVFSQNPKIEYQPTFIDPCTNQEVGGQIYHMKQLAADTIVDQDKIDVDRIFDWPAIMVLPDTGWYQIYFERDPLFLPSEGRNSRSTYIDKAGLIQDTFSLNVLELIRNEPVENLFEQMKVYLPQAFIELI